MFYDKFLSLCVQKGVSPSAVAKELGLSSGTVPNWKKGSVPRSSQIKMVADYFGLTVEELLGKPTDGMPEGIYRITTKKIPLLGEIACGMPQPSEQEVDVMCDVNSDVKADFAVKAHGDSMTGARIYDGDIVLCKFQPMVENGEIAVVIIEDEKTLKRVHYDREKGILMLYPENPSFPILKYEGEELNHIRILGKAVYRYGEVK